MITRARLRGLWARRPRLPLEEWSSGVLAVVGSVSSIGVYLALEFLMPLRPLVRQGLATSESIPREGLVVMAALVFVNIYLWFMSCAAKRSSELPYRRWFK